MPVAIMNVRIQTTLSLRTARSTAIKRQESDAICRNPPETPQMRETKNHLLL